MKMASGTLKVSCFVRWVALGLPLGCADDWVPAVRDVRRITHFCMLVSSEAFGHQQSHSHLWVGNPSFGSSFFAMSFRQQLARNAVNFQQSLELEKQLRVQAWVAKIKQEFEEECDKASRRGQFSCEMRVLNPNMMSSDWVKLQLQGILVEFGFPDGTVGETNGFCYEFSMFAEWRNEDATGSIPEPHPSGTCANCPICQEHKPAVALIPCGHVICRDCHRGQQLRQCPMCRGPILSATNGLFMDWRGHFGKGWHLMRWWDFDGSCLWHLLAKDWEVLQFWMVSRWAVQQLKLVGLVPKRSYASCARS